MNPKLKNKLVRKVHGAWKRGLFKRVLAKKPTTKGFVRARKCIDAIRY